MTRKPSPPPAYWTVPEVAELLRQSARQVRRAIARGELVASRFGRSVRVGEDDLARYLAAARGC
jgi:excisionase family DNA binding protein